MNRDVAWLLGSFGIGFVACLLAAAFHWGLWPVVATVVIVSVFYAAKRRRREVPHVSPQPFRELNLNETSVGVLNPRSITILAIFLAGIAITAAVGDWASAGVSLTAFVLVAPLALAYRRRQQRKRLDAGGTR